METFIFIRDIIFIGDKMNVMKLKSIGKKGDSGPGFLFSTAFWVIFIVVVLVMVVAIGMALFNPDFLLWKLF
jgi:hypothetical protein